MTPGLRPAVFVDRDGTLMVERHYLSHPEGVVLVPGAEAALRVLSGAGYVLVVVTNHDPLAVADERPPDFGAASVADAVDHHVPLL